MFLGRGIMAKLRIRQLAEERELLLSHVARDTKRPLPLIRRYWYNTADGKEHGPPLREVQLDALDDLAAFFGVSVGDLFATE